MTATTNNKFSFQKTVQSLARVLACIKPTPWEKVIICFLNQYNRLSFQLMFFFCYLLYRYKPYIGIVPKKMLLESFAWILELRMLLLQLDYIFLKVVVNMNNKLYLIYYDWPRLCPKLFG